MSDTLLANDPAARTAAGEVKDASQASTDQTTGNQGTQTETKPSTETKIGAKPGEGDPNKSLLNKDAKATPAKAEAAPDKYEPFKVPEGFTLDPTVVTEASTLFKELGLTQDAGQRLIDLYSAKSIEAAEAPYKAYTEQRKAWQDAVKADPVIGGKLAEVKATVSRALDSLGDSKLASDFREAMDLTGAGDHPAFIKAFYALAQRVGEGKSVTGSGPTTLGQKAPGATPPSAAKAMYPNLA